MKTRLYDILGEELVSALREFKIILAGGAITSLFTNKDINDFDLYFHNVEDLLGFVDEVYSSDGDILSPYSVMCNTITSRSILMMVDGVLNLQPIHFKFFENANEIFESFDFTINMGAFDFSTEEFILHDDFLIDNSQRKLTFNPKTTYPIISQLRVQKYQDRGYKISKKDAMIISMSIANLKIDTWDELEDQLSGFYGIDVSDMFDKEKDFDMMDAINMLVDTYESVEKPTQRTENAYTDIINSICKQHNYKRQLKIYKSLKLDENKITSPYYDLNWYVGEHKVVSDDEHGIYAFTSYDEAFDYRGNAIGELVLDDDSHIEYIGSKQIRIHGGLTLSSIQTKKC